MYSCKLKFKFKIVYPAFARPLLVALAKSWKATVSFVMSVHMEYLGFKRPDFHDIFYIWEFFENLLRFFFPHILTQISFIPVYFKQTTTPNNVNGIPSCTLTNMLHDTQLLRTWRWSNQTETCHHKPWYTLRHLVKEFQYLINCVLTEY